jgi:type I restriction enzyme M protein
MPNISSIIKDVPKHHAERRPGSLRRRPAPGAAWLDVFLKIMDDKDQELELIREGYQSVIPAKFQWRNWAANPEGITGDELLHFIDHPTTGLFAVLKGIGSIRRSPSSGPGLVREVFDGLNNYMKSGYAMRKVINQLNGFDFNNSEDRHLFGTIYESILIELRDAGNKGEYYTPRAITQLMTRMTSPRLGEKVLDPAAGTGEASSAPPSTTSAKIPFAPSTTKPSFKNPSPAGNDNRRFCPRSHKLILHGIDVPTSTTATASRRKSTRSARSSRWIASSRIRPSAQPSPTASRRTSPPAVAAAIHNLFVILMIQLLKPGGRCAMVLPDGCVAGDGFRTHPRTTPYRLQPPHHRPPPSVHLPPRHRLHQPAFL